MEGVQNVRRKRNVILNRPLKWEVEVNSKDFFCLDIGLNVKWRVEETNMKNNSLKPFMDNSGRGSGGRDSREDRGRWRSEERGSS